MVVTGNVAGRDFDYQGTFLFVIIKGGVTLACGQNRARKDAASCSTVPRVSPLHLPNCPQLPWRESLRTTVTGLQGVLVSLSSNQLPDKSVQLSCDLIP